MNVGFRLAAFGVLLAVIFALGVGLGSLVGPVHDPPPSHQMAHSR